MNPEYFMFLYIYTCMFVYICTHICICKNTCMCVCIYLHIFGDLNWFLLSRDSNTNTYLKLPQGKLGEGETMNPVGCQMVMEPSLCHRATWSIRQPFSLSLLHFSEAL